MCPDEKADLKISKARMPFLQWHWRRVGKAADAPRRTNLAAMAVHGVSREGQDR
jgi:hypothetical protein